MNDFGLSIYGTGEDPEDLEPLDDFIQKSFEKNKREYVTPEERKEYFGKIGLGQLDGDRELKLELYEAPRSRLEQVLQERQANNNRNLAKPTDSFTDYLSQTPLSELAGQAWTGVKGLLGNQEANLAGGPAAPVARKPAPTSPIDDPLAFTPLGGMSGVSQPTPSTQPLERQQDIKGSPFIQKTENPYALTKPGPAVDISPELTAMREVFGTPTAQAAAPPKPRTKTKMIGTPPESPDVTLSQQKLVEPEPESPSMLDQALSYLPFGGGQGVNPLPYASPLGMFADTLSDDTKRDQLGKDTWQAAGSAVQGLAQVPAGMLKSVGIAAKAIDEQLPTWLQQYGDKQTEELATYRMGQAIQETAAKAFPTDPARQKEFIVSMLPQAIGSMAGFMTMGLGSAALGGSRAVGTLAFGAGAEAPSAYEAAKAAGTQASTETPLSWGDALSPLGGLAKHLGERSADPETNARKAFLLGLGIGATEAIPIERAIARLDAAAGGTVSQLLQAHGTAAAEEFVQEFFQTTAGNAVAQSLYDEHQAIFEGAGGAGAAGGVAGFMMSVVTGMLRAKGGGPSLIPQETGERTAAPDPGLSAIPTEAPASAAAPSPSFLPIPDVVQLPSAVEAIQAPPDIQGPQQAVELQEEGPVTEEQILSALGASFPQAPTSKLIKKGPPQLEGVLPDETPLSEPVPVETPSTPPKPLGKRAQVQADKDAKAQLADLYDTFRYADAMDDQDTMQAVATQLEAKGQPLPDPEQFQAWAETRDTLMAAKKSLEVAGKERGFKTFTEVEGQGGTQEVQASKSPTDQWFKTLTSKPAASQYLAEGQKSWDAAKIDRALTEGLSLLPGETPSANVQVLLEAVQSDPKFHDLLVAEKEADYTLDLFGPDQTRMFAEEETAAPEVAPQASEKSMESQEVTPDIAPSMAPKAAPKEELAQPATQEPHKPPPSSFQQDEPDPFALTPLASPKAKAAKETQPALFEAGEGLETGVAPIIGREATPDEAPLFSKTAQEQPPEQSLMPFETVEKPAMKPKPIKAVNEPEADYVSQSTRETKFYSQLQRTLAQKMPKAAPPAQVLGILKSGTIKQEELEWSGLEEFLQGKPKVTKQEVMDYLQANQVEVKEKVLGKALTHEDLKWMKRGEHYAPSSAYSKIGRIERLPSNGRYLYHGPGGTRDGFDSLDKAKDAALQAAKNMGVDATKFSQYTLPGGENYQEHVLTLPEKPIHQALPPDYRVQEATNNPPGRRYLVLRKVPGQESSIVQGAGATEQEAIDSVVLPEQRQPDFRSSHFPDIINPVAHTRTTDRTGPNGEKILFVEEVQSDWHQQGKKKGYKTEQPAIEQRITDLTARMQALRRDQPGGATDSAEYTRLWEERSELRAQYNKLHNAVPGAPFKKTWHELAMKKMLRKAVDEGYDSLSWITGEETAKRYDLSKQVDEIEWDGQRNTAYVTLKGVKGISDQDFSFNVDRKTGIVGTTDLGVIEKIEGKPLAEVVGKDIAEQILERPSGRLKEEGLRVGGTWAKSLYDKMIPQFLQKFTKKWGGKVGETRIPTPTSNKWEIVNVATGESLAGPFLSMEEAEMAGVPAGATIQQLGGELTVHSLEITPAMRDSVQREGLALFEKEAPYGTLSETARERATPVQRDDQPTNRQIQRPSTTDMSPGRPEPRGPVSGDVGPGSRVSDRAAPDAPDRTRRPPGEGGGIRTVLGLAQRRRRAGRIDLNGHDLSGGIHAIAEVSQVFRDRNEETLRFVFVTDGTYLTHRGITSRRANIVVPFMDEAGLDRLIGEVNAQAEAVGATDVYAVHNHPSGNPVPSDPDIRLTRELARRVRGFKGHIVVNHHRYAVIAPSTSLIPLPDQEYTIHPIANADLRADSPKSPLNHRHIDSSQDVADLGMAVQAQEGYVTVIFATKRHGVNANRSVGIQEVPFNFATADEFQGYLRNTAPVFGGNTAYLYADNPTPALELAMMEAIQENVVRDAVVKRGDDLESLARFVRRNTDKTKERGEPLSRIHRQTRGVAKRIPVQGLTPKQAFKKTRKVMEEEEDYAVQSPMAQDKGAGSSPAPSSPEPGRTQITDTPAFKRWFKDSKVVDEQGKPLVVYHGTTKDFQAFDITKSGFIGYLKGAISFTNNPEDASRHYANRRIYQDEGDHQGAIRPAYISLKNPIIIDKRSTQHIDHQRLEVALRTALDPYAVNIEKYLNALKETIGHDGPFSSFELDAGLNFTDAGAFIDVENKNRIGLGFFYIKEIYQALGFDGAIINARQQFPEMRKIPKGTKHYSVFSTEHIWPAFSTFDQSSPPARGDSPTILKEDEAEYETPKPSAAAFADLEQQERRATQAAPATPRIAPDPIRGETPKKLREILRDASTNLNQKIWKGKTGRGAAGVYKPDSQATLTRHANDLDTAAHELAHALDDRFDFIGSGVNFPFDHELVQFWVHGSVTATGPRSTLAYKRAEGVAEWMRAYLVNPTATAQQAPRFTQHVLSNLTVEVKDALDAFGRDIRVFAGATGAQKIQANLAKTEEERPTLKERLVGTATGPGFQLRPIDRLAAKWTDRLAPMLQAYEWARTQQGLTQAPLPQDDPRVLARVLMGSNAAMDDIVQHGMTIANHAGRATPGGVKWLLGALSHDSPAILEQEKMETAAFMIAQRTLEKAKQFKRSEHISGIGGGLTDDVTVAQETLAEFAQDPDKLARLTETAARYRQWATSNLDYLLEHGRISQEQYDGILQNNEYYVAMKRLVEITPDEEIAVVVPKSSLGRHSTIGAVQQPIQSLKGSDLSILDPFESLLQATNQAVREADRNHLLRTFTDLLETPRSLHQGLPKDLASVARKAKEGEPHAIAVYRNGEKEVWQFHPDVYKSLKGIGDSPVRLPGVFTVLPRILRTTIVNAPPFALRNVIRDAFHRAIISIVGSKPWDTLKRYSPMEISDLRRFGGDQAGHYYTDDQQYMRAMKTAIEELSGKSGNVVVLAHKLGRGYLNLMQASERQGRVAEYRRAYQMATTTGVDLGDGTTTVLDPYNAGLYAANTARGLIDYAVAGEYMNWINQVIPFSNAAMQGLRVVVKRGAKAPASLLWRTMLYAAIPSIFNWLWNWWFDDLDEYRQLPAYQRDLFWNYKIGPDLWLRNPKPFELGMVGSTVERLLDLAAGNQQAFEGHGAQYLHTLAPIDEGALAGPFQGIIQALTNYDLFRQRNIVSPWEQDLELGLRTTWRGSRLGQAIQEVIGVDSRKIDFLARQQFGYFGQYATRLSDLGRPEARSIGLAEVGITTGAPAAASLDVAWVLKRAKDRGAMGTKEVKKFRKHLDRYYDATDREEKEDAAEVLRTQAALLRARWEVRPPRSDAEEKRAKKLLKEVREPDPFLELLGVQ